MMAAAERASRIVLRRGRGAAVTTANQTHKSSAGAAQQMHAPSLPPQSPPINEAREIAPKASQKARQSKAQMAPLSRNGAASQPPPPPPQHRSYLGGYPRTPPRRTWAARRSSTMRTSRANLMQAGSIFGQGCQTLTTAGTAARVRRVVVGGVSLADVARAERGGRSLRLALMNTLLSSGAHHAVSVGLGASGFASSVHGGGGGGGGMGGLRPASAVERRGRGGAANVSERLAQACQSTPLGARCSSLVGWSSRSPRRRRRSAPLGLARVAAALRLRARRGARPPPHLYAGPWHRARGGRGPREDTCRCPSRSG